ncbi:MAG: oligoendopeptidase [Chloroflexota bacterium]
MAQAVSSSSAAGVTWDLSEFFAGPDDPRIEETLAQAQQRAEAFAARYRGTINVPGGPSADHLLAALQEYEDLHDTVMRVAYYAHLLYSADTTNEFYRDLEQKVEQRTTALQNTLLFFTLEWLDLDDEPAERLINDSKLATYRHYLKSSRRYRSHKLSEPEEKIVNEKDVTGANAWQRLFTETISALSFPVEIEGEVRKLTLSEVLSLMYVPDRDLRRRAMESLYEVLSQHEHLLTFIYDTLILDRLTMDRLRKYPDPMAERHLANEIEAEAVERMMQVTEANYDIAHEYFRLKAKLLGLPRLMLYDQYAPISAEARPYTWNEAKAAILEALGAFTPEFRRIAAEFFERRWIDAEVRPGKRGGAFCASPSPRLHPYILCNYTDRFRDAMTVAHELGHGLHYYLARTQTPLNYHTPLTMAETASVFAEMLVFDYLVARETDPRARLALLASKIEDSFATVFRQNVLTRFEQDAYNARKETRLTPQKLGEFWLRQNGRYYGDTVEMIPGYRWGWSYIPHFINTRFYTYAYVFGELLVLALYRMYREEGASFVPRYLRLLESGGSASPAELLASVGADVRDPDFWQKGLAELRRLVQQATELVERITGTA